MKQTKSDYEEYLDKYCRSRGFCREEAERHLIVQNYKKMCEEREKEHGERHTGTEKPL